MFTYSRCHLPTKASCKQLPSDISTPFISVPSTTSATVHYLKLFMDSPFGLLQDDTMTCSMLHPHYPRSMSGIQPELNKHLSIDWMDDYIDPYLRKELHWREKLSAFRAIKDTDIISYQDGQRKNSKERRWEMGKWMKTGHGKNLEEE